MVLGLTSHNAALVTAGSDFHRILLPLCLSASPQTSVILENSSWHLIHSLSPASEGWGFGGGDALSAPSWCQVSDEQGAGEQVLLGAGGPAGCSWKAGRSRRPSSRPPFSSGVRGLKCRRKAWLRVFMFENGVEELPHKDKGACWGLSGHPRAVLRGDEA